MTPAIRAALLSITGREDTFLKRRGALLEDIVALQLYREFVATGAGTLSYDSSKSASDFVLQVGNQKQIAIEVGAGDDKGIAQLKSTMEKIKCDFGIVFCPGDMALVREERFIKIPPAYSLLM